MRKFRGELMGKEKYLEQVKDLINGSPYYQHSWNRNHQDEKGACTLQLRSGRN